MNSIRTIGILTLAIMLGMCSRQSTAPEETDNLLTNSSFEFEGQPTLDGWSPANPQLAELVSSPAPGGGSYALRLEADWAPTLGFVTAKVDGLHDGEIVQLSAFVRAIGPDGGGSLSLISGPSDEPAAQRVKTLEFSDESWNQMILTDTLQLNTGDDVWVKLSSPITEVVPRAGLFDLVELLRM